MNRITVEDVETALKKTGARLRRGITWQNYTSGIGPCGCPIGTVSASQIEDNRGWISFCRAYSSVGLTPSYANGFALGFDNPNYLCPPHSNVGMVQGFQDALAVVEHFDGRIEDPQ